ncbi:metallophosphoesterase [Fibrella sp. WM1]|uniref:metallophosphoesterase family protein n=1 Tax=Fibrella musci TaxID=3242485 RepID=UPI0035202CDB
MTTRPTILNPGELSGPLLIFGGPYSNLQALEAMQRIAEQHRIPPGNVICTGDIVGYCAQPEACIQLVNQWGIWAIQGNVEQNLVDGEADCGCNFSEGGRCDTLSRTWFPYAARSVSEASRQWLGTLPLQLRFTYAGRVVAVVHGSAQHIAEFIFESTPWAVKDETFAATGADVVLAGHAGLPFADERGHACWLNAGVIGMPANDGTPRVWYLLLDDADGQFSYRFVSFTYDNQTAHQQMVTNQLPLPYAQTLLTGLWDNCEILPETEKQAQGVALLPAEPV